jgi:HK97 gp10 family phage protein
VIAGSVSIQGEKRLIEELKRLEGALSKKIQRPAVTKAGRVMRTAIAGTAPTKEGNLKRSMGMKVRSYRSIAVAVVGPRTNYVGTRVNQYGRVQAAWPVKYAHLVEGGTKAHAIPFGPKELGAARPLIRHPGARPARFMARAYASAAGRAMSVLNDELEAGLNRYT